MDSHQDFKEIILINPSSKKNKIVSSQPNVVVSKLQKQLLNDDDECPKIKTFGKDNGKTLQNARTRMKMTQEQLANKINEKKKCHKLL